MFPPLVPGKARNSDAPMKVDRCIGTERGKVKVKKLKEKIHQVFSVFGVNYLDLIKNLFENRS